MPLPSQEGPGLDVDEVARGLAELEFDARVALPEAQERFKRAEAERDRYRHERDAWKAYAESLEALIAGHPYEVARPEANGA